MTWAEQLAIEKDIRWVYFQMATAQVKSSPTYINGWGLPFALNRVICGTEFLSYTII